MIHMSACDASSILFAKRASHSLDLLLKPSLILMWPDMFYSHKRPMRGKLPPGISQLPDEIEPTFQRLPPPQFSTTAIPMALTGILPDLKWNGKSKMAAYKLVASIYRLAGEIEGQFQRQTQCFKNWKAMNWSEWCHFVAQPYWGKVTKAFLLTPSGYKIVSKILVWRGKIHPQWVLFGLKSGSPFQNPSL